MPTPPKAVTPVSARGARGSTQLRAVHLVVDIGLQTLGWSRERAVRELVDASGRPAAAMQGEVDRYCVEPGQACGYMIGQAEFLRLRSRWLAARRGVARSPASTTPC